MTALAAPADRRFRRAQLKPSRRRRAAWRHAWLLLRALAVIGVVTYASWRGMALVLGAPALQVSQVVVTGTARLSTGEVLALVDGLQERHILTLDLDFWRDRLLASPWVLEATLRRVLPSTVDIAIRERHPVALARLAGELYLVDRDGVIVDAHGAHHAAFDLPIVDGLAAPPGEGDGLIEPRRMRLADRLIAELAAEPELAARVSQIDVSDPYDAAVLLDGDTALLRLGDARFVERLHEYLELAPALKQRIPAIDYVDLRFDDRLYVRPAAGVKPGPSKR